MLTEPTLRAWTPGATTTSSRDVVVVDNATGEKRVSTKKGDAIPPASAPTVTVCMP